jgi:hypothetical protein
MAGGDEHIDHWAPDGLTIHHGPRDTCQDCATWGQGLRETPRPYVRPEPAEPAGIDRTCDDCGAGPGEECAWSCSSRWGFEASDSE